MNDLVPSNVSAQSVATRFGAFSLLTVRQRKKWLEILLSFETKNQYDVFDANGQAVLQVREEGGGFLELIKRLILGPIRPFMAGVYDAMSGETLMRLHRRFRWIFHRLEISSGSGEPLGAIEKKWSWVRRIYAIQDASGHEVGEIYGPFLKPWTFELRMHGAKVGAITKKWSGFGKELFTDADNFGVDMANVPDPALKALAFAATVLIDVVHFERAKN